MSVPFAESFRGRRVFVTGHTGFIGSWLSIWLHELGAKVTGYALDPPTTPSNFALSRVDELLEKHVVADVRDAGALRLALAAAAPEVVIHLAAQPLVRKSYREPRETFEVNVIGTCNLLDAVRAYGRPCVVIVFTSDKCYENREQVWGYRECDPLGGHDPYSASKGAQEIVVQSYRRSFFDPARIAQHGVKLATVRAGNVIGGGDWAEDRLIPDIVRAVEADRPVELRNPDAVRPWQHVLEPIAGMLTLAAKMLSSTDARWCEAWNFGPYAGDQITVREIARAVLTKLGAGAAVERPDPAQPHEAGLLRLAIDKTVAALGWRPRWSASSSVERTAAWSAGLRSRAGAARQLCLDDILNYQKTAPKP